MKPPFKRIFLDAEDQAVIAEMMRANCNMGHTEPGWRVSRRTCWFRFDIKGGQFMVLWRSNKGAGMPGRIVRIWQGSRPPRPRTNAK